MAAAPKRNPAPSNLPPRLLSNGSSMWRSEPPNWHSMAMRNSFHAHFVGNPYQTPQPFMTGGSTMPQAFSYMPQQQQQQQQPQYYTQQGEAEVNTLNLTMAHMQPRIQSQSQPQQQLWYEYDYQPMQPSPDYSYWYRMQQAPAASAYQMNPRQTAVAKPQPIQAAAKSTAQIQSKACQKQILSMPGGQEQRRLAVRAPLSANGSLNRMDSVTSFQNSLGLRIRNSAEDLVQYRRIAARTLAKKQQTPPIAEATQQLKQELPKEQPKVSNGIYRLPAKQAESKIEEHEMQPITENKPTLSSERKGNSFFKKLGLLMSGSKLSSQSRKKTNFLKRLFIAEHYPTDTHVASDSNQETSDSLRFEREHAKPTKDELTKAKQI